MTRGGAVFLLALALTADPATGGTEPAGELLPSLRLVETAGGSWVFLDREGQVVGWLPEDPAAEATASLAVTPPQVPGWPRRTGEVQATLRVADIDGDGTREAVFSSIDENLYVVRADATDLPGWPLALGVEGLRSASLADVDGDGVPEMFVPAADVLGLRADGSALPGWPFRGLGFADVGIDDVDGDGEPELAFMGRDGRAHLVDVSARERPGWPFDVGNPEGHSNKGPALGDTDGDGTLEIAIPLSNFPSVYLVRGDGAAAPGFPIDFRFGLKEGISMADMDGDGTQEIVFQEDSGVRVLDGEGRPLPGWPVDAFQGAWAPAIGDLDGDGGLEVVYATRGGSARVFAFHADGTPVAGWPVIAANFSFTAQLTLGDVDGDGRVDVVGTGFTSSAGAAGRIYAYHADGTLVRGFPFAIPENKAVLGSAVTITDLDQDGDVDLLVGTITGLGGTDVGRAFAFDLDTAYHRTTLEWPTLGHDNRHTGRYAPPVRLAAHAGFDGEVECTSPAGAAVMLDGSHSADKDSSPGTNDDIVSFEWFTGFGSPDQQLLGAGERLEAALGLGDHDVTLQVTDSTGNRDTDRVRVRVADTTPPALRVEPALLWPPNHRMVEVGVTVSDACGPATARIVSAGSSEPDDAPGAGDGGTAGDVAAVDERTVALRAERAGTGPGRTYALVYEAADAAGNTAVATLEVTVPHDRGGATEPLLLAVSESAGGTAISWDDVPGARSYDVIRGDLGSLRGRGSSSRLGPIACIASAVGPGVTPGAKDPLVPEPGRGFFYLAAYDDGRHSGYGTESAAQDRFVPGGQGCP